MTDLAQTTGLLFIQSLLKYKQPISFMNALRLKDKFFHGIELDIIKYLITYTSSYKTLPNREQIEANFGIVLPDVVIEGSVDFWADEVRKRYTIESTYPMANNLVKAISNGSIDEAFSISNELNRLLVEGCGNTRVTLLEDTIDIVLDQHNKVRRDVSNFGVTFGLNFLNERCGGCQPGDLITLVGRPGAMKTFLLLHMAVEAHRAGNNVLIIPTEMSDIQYFRRLIGLRTELSVNRIKFGQLSTIIGEEILKHEKTILEETQNKLYLADASLSISVADVKATAHIYKPDVIYVDGGYLLQPATPQKSEFSKVSSVVTDLKLLGRELGIPIICTYQMGRKGTGVDNIYMSDVIGQLSSIVFVMESIDDMEVRDVPIDEWEPVKKYKQLTIKKGRDGESGSISLILDVESTKVLEGEIAA